MSHPGIVTKTVSVRVWDNAKHDHVTVDVEVKVNLNWLAQDLGQKATKNKNRQSSLRNGSIVATIKGSK